MKTTVCVKLPSTLTTGALDQNADRNVLPVTLQTPKNTQRYFCLYLLTKRANCGRNTYQNFFKEQKILDEPPFITTLLRLVTTEEAHTQECQNQKGFIFTYKLFKQKSKCV